MKFREAHLWDRLEASIALVLFGGMAYYATKAFANQPSLEHFFKVIHPTIVCSLFAIRKRSRISPTPPLLSIFIISHCTLPMFLTERNSIALIDQRITAVLVILGVLVSTLAITDLWTSFGILPANRGIVKQGLYRIVRHPIYLGYSITGIGIVLGYFSWQNASIFLIFLCGVVARIIIEEKFLTIDDSYLHYSSSVKYRLVPGVY